MGAAKKQLGDLGSQEGCGPPWGSVLSMSLAQFRMARTSGPVSPGAAAHPSLLLLCHQLIIVVPENKVLPPGDHCL